MKLKTILIVTAILSVLVSTACGRPPVSAMLVKVIDENGEPVEGAEAIGRFLWRTDKLIPAPKGLTDANGEIILRGRTIQQVTAEAYKDGYYPSKLITTIPYPGSGHEAVPHRSADFAVTLVLREIRDQVPMYARRLDTRIPGFGGEAAGYDLEKMDWVSPHGEGVRGDIYMRLDGQIDDRQIWDVQLTISFPGDGDGLVVFEEPPYPESVFKSPRIAPDDGYVSKWTLRNRRITREAARAAGVSPVAENDVNQERVYIFRVRTQLDDDDNPVGGHYAKMYGDFYFGIPFTKDAFLTRGILYFNPVPEDRNLEYDPESNLLEDSGEPPRGFAP